MPQFQVEREAGASREEYLRQLRLVFPDCAVAADGAMVVTAGATRLEIVLTPLPPRAIALLSLPRLKVSLRGTAASAAAWAALLAHMDLAMRRGGG